MKEMVYLFLDEVHLHEGFEVELKVLHDLERTKIFASGSASIFLLEKGAYLTGRQHFINVYPFDFREYLDLNGISLTMNDTSPLIKYAEDHVLFGGLPEYLLRRDAEYLTDLLESILYKDIMTRHALKNMDSIMDLALLLSRSVGNPLSNRRMARILDLSHTTVSDYVSFFLEIKLIDLIESEGKISERKVSPKKIYLTDNGMARVISPSLNLGALVENLVFNELKKKYEPRYMISHGKEIDFVFEDHAIEVKYKNRITKMDIDPLKKLRGYKNKTLITKTKSGEMDGVRMLPLYRFLLEGL
jgi:predicted AAA+ superfamily ATPase